MGVSYNARLWSDRVVIPLVLAVGVREVPAHGVTARGRGEGSTFPEEAVARAVTGAVVSCHLYRFAGFAIH